MIDAALRPIQATLAIAVLYGEMVALQSWGQHGFDGKYLCAEHGGPTADGDPFELTGRTGASAWESWTVARGKEP